MTQLKYKCTTQNITSEREQTKDENLLNQMNAIQTNLIGKGLLQKDLKFRCVILYHSVLNNRVFVPPLRWHR